MNEKHYATAPEDGIPLGQKVAFGVGMLGNQMFPTALSIFTVVLVKGLGMDPMLWAILFFLPRLFDALTEPIMGFITDNTRSRCGHRRPYIFAGAIIAGVSYILPKLWSVSGSPVSLSPLPERYSPWQLCRATIFRNKKPMKSVKN